MCGTLADRDSEASAVALISITAAVAPQCTTDNVVKAAVFIFCFLSSAIFTQSELRDI